MSKQITLLKNSEIGRNVITVKGKEDEYCLILENEIRYKDRESTVEEYLINLKNKTVSLFNTSEMTDIDNSLVRFIKETFMKDLISLEIYSDEFKSFVLYQIDKNSPIRIGICKDDKIYLEDKSYRDFDQFVLASKSFDFIEFFQFQ